MSTGVRPEQQDADLLRMIDQARERIKTRPAAGGGFAPPLSDDDSIDRPLGGSRPVEPWERNALEHILPIYQGATAGTGKHFISALRTFAEDPVGSARSVVGAGLSMAGAPSLGAEVSGDNAGPTMDAYGRNLNDVQGMLDSARERHPVVSTLEELAGALPTAGRSIPTMIGRVAAPALRELPMAERLARVVLPAAAEGAVYGGVSGAAEAARPGASDADIRRGAAIGSVAGGVMAPVVGAVARPIAERGGAVNRLTRTPNPTDLAKTAATGRVADEGAIGATGTVLNTLRRQRRVQGDLLYGLARTEAEGKDYPPALLDALESPTVRDAVHDVLARERAPAFGTLDFAGEVKKAITDEILTLEQQLRNKIPLDRPRNEITARLRDARKAADQLTASISGETTRPAITMDVPLASATPGPTKPLAADVAEGMTGQPIPRTGREPAYAPPPKEVMPEHDALAGQEAAVTQPHSMHLTDEQQALLDHLLRTASAKKAIAEGNGQAWMDAMLRQLGHEPMPLPTPEFRAKSAPPVGKPGVSIEPPAAVPNRDALSEPSSSRGGAPKPHTGLEPGGEAPTSMRIETAPAETVPPFAPTFSEASRAYRTASERIRTIQRGHDFLREMVSGSVGAGKQQGLRGEAGLQELLRTAGPQEVQELIVGLSGSAASHVQKASTAARFNAATGGLATKVAEIFNRHDSSPVQAAKALEAYTHLFPREYQRPYQILTRAFVNAARPVSEALSPTP